MYTKFVVIAPLTSVDSDFSINLKRITGYITGTMCAKCVLTVPLTTVNSDLLFNLKKLLAI